jgi:hypothetical protein
MSAVVSSMPQADGSSVLPGLSDRAATRLALWLLLLGLLWRTVRYLLQFPIWGDEAMLAMNFASLDYAQLTQRLENCQIAPLLFLWGERAAYCWFGAGELSMRLFPFLAGMLALVLYWRLTGLLLEPRARLFAVGFLAVAYFPVTMCSLLKPYSFDLLMALVLLVPAVQWLMAPNRTRWLAVLTLLVPVAVLGSYPVVFVAGGITLALCRQVWQQGWLARSWFAGYHIALLAGFFVVCLVGNNHLHTSTYGRYTQTGMTTYWAHAFPPGNPGAWPLWFARLTAGQMSAYPVGASDGGSTLTVLCCLAGAACWARRRQWLWLILFGVPLLLNLAAAAMHRYPYGGAARLSQHLAPGLCLLAGLGLAALLRRAKRWPASHVRWTFVAVLFACIGLGGLLRDVVHPYSSPGCAWMRDAMHAMRAEVPPGERVVMCGNSQSLECVFVWYWLTEGDRVTWNYQLPAADPAGRQLWGFHQGAGADAACQQLAQTLVRQDAAWHLVKRVPYTFQPRNRKELPQHCELFCFARSL